MGSFLLSLVWSCHAAGNPAGSTTINGQTYHWVHTTTLPSKMQVSWIDKDPNYVTIEMKGPTKGYVSIGFSPSGGMTGADMFVGWVDSNGTAHLLVTWKLI